MEPIGQNLSERNHAQPAEEKACAYAGSGHPKAFKENECEQPPGRRARTETWRFARG